MGLTKQTAQAAHHRRCTQPIKIEITVRSLTLREHPQTLDAALFFRQLLLDVSVHGIGKVALVSQNRIAPI
jgi:hypothetical protein